ncbi:MAG: DUF1553 domain-containing protein [Bacteroidales bacterium]|nr:DUF1553 domain-containing protein [Bacteroidales bacterium]
MRFTIATAFVTILSCSLFASAPHAERAERLAFFEKKIRPVLMEHCQRCHSIEAEKAGKLKGSLRVDTREGLLVGGDSGPAIVPGKPKESLFLQSLHYDGDIRMPPKGKLSDAIIADFAKWIQDGAVDPREDTKTVRPRSPADQMIAAGKNFWSYRPVVSPTAPAVQNKKWPLQPMDAFILAKLESQGLAPAPDADRRTLIHRLYQDLIGLPPSLAEVDAFLADSSPDAYEQLVDRLLASPRFGEHWGRHWLDVARFAESVTLRGLIFQEAWRYRDYVIDCYNRDVPFHRMIVEQIAGDLLPASSLAEQQRLRIATTFLMLGNTNLEDQDKQSLRMDFIDEQLDVIGKGFLAQTITCARCHDHKFDPIPTADYYAMAAILRNVQALEDSNVSRWVEVPLPLTPAEEKTFAQQEAQVAQLQAEIKKFKSAMTAQAAKAGKILALKDIPGIAIDAETAKKVGEWQLSQFSGTYIGSGYVHDRNEKKGEKSITFEPAITRTGRYEVRLAYASGESRAEKVPVSIFSADGEKDLAINMKITPALDGRFVSLGTYRFEKNGQSYVTISTTGTTGHVTVDAITFVPEEEATKKISAPAKKQPSPGDQSHLAGLEAKLKKLQKTAPKRPMAMSVKEEPKITEGTILIRGVVHNIGASVPRGVLQVATIGKPPVFPKDQSGRRELAEWIAQDANPLTARVYVNRVWHWLFGVGLVRTTDNFGTTGELPSHPQLLDALTQEFVRDGWSTKKLIRRMVLSRTYRLSSDGATLTRPADPDNRWLAHAHRKRLTGEAIRDKILSLSGQLDLTAGGRSFPANLASDYGFQAETNQRSVYLPVFRGAMPELVAVFDAADPSLVTGNRNTSTIAPQALYFMNHAFIIEQARLAAVSLLKQDGNPTDRAYRLTLGRLPTDRERSVIARFLETQSDSKEAWSAILQSLIASAEFRMIR